MTERERQETAAEEEEEESYLEGMAVVDFDMLCSTVAMQTHGKWTKLQTSDDHHNAAADAGVLRMWEGDLLDCFEDRRIAIESACCPCYRYGKNMRRAGFGSCFLQGTMHFIIVFSALLSCISFIVTKRNCFLYMSVALTISVGLYLGFFRTHMRKKFNIMGNDSSLDDCIYHLICPCCTLCQESRTLEMNNIQDGTWHGRGDTICIEGTKAFFELQPPNPVPPMLPHDCTIQISINTHP